MGAKFIGPGYEAIEGMGDKILSMRIAQEAGVSCAPRHDGEIATAEEALEVAEKVGFPVIMKATAGGGGKGMKLAWSAEELPEQFNLAKQEAAASFGDDRMLVQHYVCPYGGRHIEIQVLGDKHGNYVYLPERECSIQRRHQKVIEEAPSVLVDPEMRKKMGEQAVALAAAVGYESAGTVEFLVDPHSKKWYFLEMNTRLQVEHPITEAITGVDLVEEMIRIAAGEKLRLTQDDVRIEGWAVEARVYAEDSVNYMPSIGRLSTYIEPKADVTHMVGDTPTPNVRVDTGVIEGSEISVYYDPMICKLITYGRDRTEALSTMAGALDSYVIKGVQHNIPLLRDVIQQPTFVSGDFTTEFLTDVYPDKFSGYTLSAEERKQLASSAVFVHVTRILSEQRFRNFPSSSAVWPSEYVVVVDGEEHTVSAGFSEDLPENSLAVSVDGGDAVGVTSDWAVGDAVFRGSVGDAELTVQTLGRRTCTYALRFCGTEFDVDVRDARIAPMYDIMPEPISDFNADEVVTPMPGVVVSVDVKPGDAVSAGQTVAVVEAMKMQNNLSAPRAGIIKAVFSAVGDSLDDGSAILVLEPEDEPEGDAAAE